MARIVDHLSVEGLGAARYRAAAEASAGLGR